MFTDMDKTSQGIALVPFLERKQEIAIAINKSLLTTDGINPMDFIAFQYVQFLPLHLFYFYKC